MNLEPSLPQLASGKTTEHVGYNEALENYQKNTSWWMVYACFDLPDFDPSPLWIGSKIGLPVDEVVDALEGLVVLGHLEKSQGAFYPVKGKSFVHFNFDRQSNEEVIERHALVSQQILNDLDPNEKFAFDHGMIAGTPQILTELYQDIAQAIQKAAAKAQLEKNNVGLYKITFTAVDVLKKNDRKASI